MLPPLKTLPVFIAVAQQLSFSKAAAQLHVTHSAVSQSIRLLEDFLGQKLFVRNANKVTLSKQGKVYYSEISSALQMIDNATEKQLAIKQENIITIKIMATLALLWFIPRLPKFQGLYPDIDLRLSTLEYQPVDFERNAIDAAIVCGYPEEWSELKKEKLFTDSLVLVGNPKHIKMNSDLNILLTNNKAIYVDAELRKNDWKNWCKTAKVKLPTKSQRVIFQKTAQALQAVVSGVGVMVTHKPFVYDLIKLQQLSLLSSVESFTKKNYYLVYKQIGMQNKPLQLLIDWIKAETIEIL